MAAFHEDDISADGVAVVYDVYGYSPLPEGEWRK